MRMLSGAPAGARPGRYRGRYSDSPRKASRSRMSVAGADGAPSGASNAISVSARTTRVIFRLTTTAFGFLAFAFLALARAAGLLGALRFGAFARLAVFFAAFFFFRAVIE